jgi:hypothetical protein
MRAGQTLSLTTVHGCAEPRLRGDVTPPLEWTSRCPAQDGGSFEILFIVLSISSKHILIFVRESVTVTRNPMMVINIQDFLSGNVVQVGFVNQSPMLWPKLSQDATFLDDIARQISAIQRKRPEIKRYVSYQIEKKGDRDSRRRTKSLNIGILDEETKQLLDLRHQEWMDNPGAFWLPSEIYPTSQLPLVAQIASYYLQAQRADV